VKTWQKFLLSILVTLAIGGLYLFSVWKHRQNPGVLGRDDTAGQKLSSDDLAVVRMIFPAHFEDTLKLQGTRVWMKNGYTMAYFPYAGRQVVFAKRLGLIPSAQRLDIKTIVKSAVPANVDNGISHGSRQAFAVFALPGSTDLYATAIGAIQGDEESYYCDLLFYYDDPHTIYDNWSKDTWAAIDAHQVKPGMSELQTRMAIGQNIHADGSSEGNRTVTYDQAGKHWTITYVDNRATAIKSA
jgi:hypothetical protein